MKENRDETLMQRLGETDPGLERIAIEQSGCRCGVEGCEFAADFTDAPAESILKEIHGLNDEQKDKYVEQLIAPSDAEFAEEVTFPFDAGSADELMPDDLIAPNGAEFAEELTTPDDAEFGEELVTLTEDSEENDAEFGDELTGYDIYPVPVLPGFGSTMEAGFDPAEDNGEDVYHSTADYHMIEPDSGAFNAQGS